MDSPAQFQNMDAISAVQRSFSPAASERSDLLLVPDFPSGPSSSPSCLSVPGSFGHSGSMTDFSRQTSSAMSSLFDMTNEAEQLDKAIRNNNTGVVARLLSIYYHRFSLREPSLLSPACSIDLRKMSNISVFSDQFEQPTPSGVVETEQRRYSAQAQYGWSAAPGGDESDTRRSSCTRSDDHLSVVFRNALHVAIQHSSLDVLNLMLSCGVDPNQPGVNFSDGSRRSSSISDIALARDRRDVRFHLASRLPKRRNASQDSSSQDEKHARRRPSRHSAGGDVGVTSSPTLAGHAPDGVQPPHAHLHQHSTGDDTPSSGEHTAARRAAFKPNGQLTVVASPRDRPCTDGAELPGHEPAEPSGSDVGNDRSASVTGPEVKPLNVPDITIDGYSTPSSPTVTPSAINSPSPVSACWPAGPLAIDTSSICADDKARPASPVAPSSGARVQAGQACRSYPTSGEHTASKQQSLREGHHVCRPSVSIASPITVTAAAADNAAADEDFDFAAVYTAQYVQQLPPLYLGVAERKPEAVRLLLRYGANPHVADAHGCTPLHLSASADFQSWDCALALIEHGARIHVTNNYGVSPCHLSPDLHAEQRQLLRRHLDKLERWTREAVRRNRAATDKGSVLNLFSLNEFHDIAVRLFQKRRKSTHSDNVHRRSSRVSFVCPSTSSDPYVRSSIGGWSIQLTPTASQQHETEDLDMDSKSVVEEKEPLSTEKQGLIQRMSSKRSSKNKSKSTTTAPVTSEQSEWSPLIETQKSLETLIKLASNPECLPSLLDGLSGCIQAIVTVTEQVDVESLDQLLMSLLIQIVQTCNAEISSNVSSHQKLTAFHHLMRILQVCIDILKSKHAGLLYCALCTMNHVVDACIVHEAHHLWLLEQNEAVQRPDGASSGQDARCSQDATKRTPSTKAESGGHGKDAAGRDLKNSLKSGHFGKKQAKSGRMHFMSHQDSNWSLRSILTHFDSMNYGSAAPSQEASFAETEPEAEAGGTAGGAAGSAGGHESPQLSVQSPLDVLTGSDPVLIVGILQEAINRYKAGMNRHKCTPSVRQMSCSNHCVQILSARILTLMCHSQIVQQKLVKNGHIKVLVEALDPNHDPHLLCLLLQALACIAMTPAHHQTLTEADVPDTLMQLLLPSDEWYYTNHSTRYARYVKYHAARILVYMGHFHRLGGRVNLFDLKPFEQVSNNQGNVLQMHYAEDSFIDQMALGKVLVRDEDGRIYAGSLEGIILEIIQECERELSSHPPGCQPTVQSDQMLYGCQPSSRHRQAQSEPSSSSGVSSQPDVTPSTSLFSGLRKCAFGEYFFHTAPLVVHPIIILRLFCHKMFGNMLRRKTSFSLHNLSPPVVLEKKQCPPWKPNQAPADDSLGGDPAGESSVATRRRRANLHVQISTPSHIGNAEEEIRLTRRRTKRAGSIDKHLMRLSSAKRRAATATMTNALKAIGDSLMTPLDLNISPNTPSYGAPDEWAKKKPSFRFPSLKKRSRSQGYLAGLPDSCESFAISDSPSGGSADQRNEMLELTKELINLPTFEIDTHRVGSGPAMVLSRCSSVPELDHSAAATNSQKVEPLLHEHMKSKMTVLATCKEGTSDSDEEPEANQTSVNGVAPVSDQSSLTGRDVVVRNLDVAGVMPSDKSVTLSGTDLRVSAGAPSKQQYNATGSQRQKLCCQNFRSTSCDESMVLNAARSQNAAVQQVIHETNSHTFRIHSSPNIKHLHEAPLSTSKSASSVQSHDTTSSSQSTNTSDVSGNATQKDKHAPSSATAAAAAATTTTTTTTSAHQQRSHNGISCREAMTPKSYQNSNKLAKAASHGALKKAQASANPLKKLCELGPSWSQHEQLKHPKNECTAAAAAAPTTAAPTTKESRGAPLVAPPVAAGHKPGAVPRQAGQLVSSDEDVWSSHSSSTNQTCKISVTSAVESEYPFDQSADSSTSGSVGWGSGSPLGNQCLLSPIQDVNRDSIIFKFAAATPCESPVSLSTADFPTLSLANKTESCTASTLCTLSPYYSMENLTSSNVSIPSTVIPATPQPRKQAMDLLSVGTPSELAKDPSQNSLTVPSPCERPSPDQPPNGQEFSLVTPSPELEVPLQHQSIMKVIETWARVCSLDLECDSVMRKEVKDFLNKVASLGRDYRVWSHNMYHTLKLEEDELSQESADDATNADNIHQLYKKLQKQVLTGDLPCTKEEAATLAGIQLHLEETWPEDPHTPDMTGASDDPNELEQRHLLRVSSREPSQQRKKICILEKDRAKLVPGRRSGKLTKNPLFCFDRGDGSLMCFRIPDGRMANALPPNHRRCTTICKLIEEKQTKLWHTTYYDSELKLKQLYIKICKNLPAYNCKLYNVKEIRRGNTHRKVSCLLGVSPEKVILLDNKTKLLLQAHDIHELQEWSTGTGRNLDGLKLEFRGSKPWSLVAPSCERLKSITGALLDMMGTENRLFDCLLLHQNPVHMSQHYRGTLSGSLHSRHSNQSILELYTEELSALQKLLHFPEEVAMRLTETEYKLFNSVPPMSYVRQVTMDLSSLSRRLSGGQDVSTLIQRFYEVSSWVTHLIITQPTHEDRKAVLSCILRLVQTCWNIGNFNSAVEILVGLKSEKLKPFWLSVVDEDLSQLDTLSNALLTQVPSDEYRQAVTRALNIPGCQVVPFFGGFLRDLQMVLSGIPSIVVLPPNGECSLKLVSEFRGEDKFITRIGVGGLINMEKVHQAHCVLTDIHLFHKHAEQGTLVDLQHLETQNQDLISTTEPEAKPPNASGSDDEIPDLDLGQYEPISSIGNEHEVMMIPSKVTHPDEHGLQLLHHGATAIHWDTKDSHSVICFLKLENDNATLSWSKTNWSCLHGTSVSLPPDYLFQGEEDCRISSPLINRYISGVTFVEEIEEGQLDLLQVKSVSLGDASADISLLQRRHNISQLAPRQNCLTFVVGGSISENRVLEFVLPPVVLASWYACLRKLVDAAQYIRHRRVDRRVQWLKDLYLQLYYEGEACLAPTSADAFRAFGGRNWNTEINSNMTSENTASGKKNSSPVGSLKSAKVKKRSYGLPTFKDLSSKSSSHDQLSDTTNQQQGAQKSSKQQKVSSKPVLISDRRRVQSKQNINMQTMFHPKSLTFGFQNRGLPIHDLKHFSLKCQLQESSQPVTHISQFSFMDFIQLFKCFYILMRKDIKELFDEFALNNPEPCTVAADIKSRLQQIKYRTGILTRNMSYLEQLTKEQHKFYEMLCSASIMENRVDSGKEKSLGIKELTDFLVEYQEENPSPEDIMKIIMKHEQDPEYRDQSLLSFEGFCCYLLDQDNYAFVPEAVSQDTQDMDHPLSHYYVKSSHNTYLTGHQLKGESSVEMYTQVLLTGCRCVELDCWDGDDDNPVIYHGHTLTTKIPFRAVVEAINASAFVTSPYPVILSLENHCSISQQQKMAQIFVEVFGEKLVRNFLFEADFSDDPVLPSPNQLKYKILIKNKKLHNPETQINIRYKLPTGAKLFTMDTIPNDDEEEEDEEDEEDFLADSGVKDMSSLQSQGLLSLEKCNSVDHSTGTRISGQISDFSRELGGSTGCLTFSNQGIVSPSTKSYIRAKSMGHLVAKSESETTSVTTLPSTPLTPRDRKRASSVDNYLNSISSESLKTNSQDLLQYNSAQNLLGPSEKCMFYLDKTSSCPPGGNTGAGDAGPLIIEPAAGGAAMGQSGNSKMWFGMTRNGPKRDTDGNQRSVDAIRNATMARDRPSLEKDTSRGSSDDQKSRDMWKSQQSADWAGSEDRDSDHATKPMKRKKVAIAQELSDLVIYTQAIKFKGLINVTTSVPRHKRAANRRNVLAASRASSVGNSPSPTEKVDSVQRITIPIRKAEEEGTPSCFQMSSLNENKAKQEFRKHPTAVISHTERHLMRTYPAGTRIDSSNFNPIFFWAFGLQFAALNYQTEDLAMQINTAMFEQTGRSGYVLKPRVMWDRTHILHSRFNPLDKELDGYQPVTLKIHLISGQYTCPGHRSGSPQVEVEMLGIPVDCIKHKSKVISRNQLNPIWNELYTFQVHFQDLAFIRWTVTETTSGHVTGQRIIPLKCLRQGFRHIRLRNSKNHPLEMSTLFIYSRLEDDVNHDLMTFTVNSTKKESSGAVDAKQSGVLSSYLADSTRCDKEAAQVPMLRQKRRLFFISVFGVTKEDEYVILNVTQETTVHEAIQQALNKAGKSGEHSEEYVLEEVVSHGWERPGGSTVRSILDMGEKVLQAQNKWKGHGKFVLRKITNDPSTRAWVTTMVKDQRLREGSQGSEYTDGSWDSNQETYLVCIYEVSEDQPYTILQAPRSSTSQDIITQALVKARRKENPQNFVLVEEISGSLVTSPKERSNKVTYRILGDDENVYKAQHAWRNNAGKFILTCRDKVHSQTMDNNQHEKAAIQKFSLKFPILKKKKKQEDTSHSYQMQPLDSKSQAIKANPELHPRGPTADMSLNAGFLRVAEDSKVDIKPHALPRGHKILPHGKYS